jgi:uncharacterized protein (DUF169 family)
MHSKIAAAVKLRRDPVAILLTDRKPKRALEFTEEHGQKNRCIIPLFVAAVNGRTAVLEKETVLCPGGKVGLCFGPYQLGYIEYFLSTGKTGQFEGEYRKKTPELVRKFIENLPAVAIPTRYVVMKPLNEVEDYEIAETAIVVFLVNADQLSALATLANFDRPTNDNVSTLFGSGCGSLVMQVLAQEQSEMPKAVIGLTDITARKYIDKNDLAFSVPFKRFLEMEANVEESFLTKGKDWPELLQRL